LNIASNDKIKLWKSSIVCKKNDKKKLKNKLWKPFRAQYPGQNAS
jgi:hypothetical protein